MDKLKNFLNFSLKINDKIHLDIKNVLFIIFIIVITRLLLKLIRKLINRKLAEEDKGKFKAVFSFLQYFVYVFVLIIALESAGIQVGVLLAGSAALLVGIGLGLQTLFQDIISGVFILLDKTLTVNDIVEVDDKIGKIIEIKLRTTRAVTIDNKVLIIPNHKFLTQSLFNWTQNGTQTTQAIEVGVAYGSDVELVKNILIGVAKSQTNILQTPIPKVLFVDFGDSALQFRLLFSVKNSFSHLTIKSDLRFKIDKEFRKHNITIPFPQRDIHYFRKNE